MAAEAAVLGTPSLRFNDFVGEISYLEELEHAFGLTYGIRTDNSQKLLDKTLELLSLVDLKQQFRLKQEKMLESRIDLNTYMITLFNEFSN